MAYTLEGPMADLWSRGRFEMTSGKSMFTKVGHKVGNLIPRRDTSVKIAGKVAVRQIPVAGAAAAALLDIAIDKAMQKHQKRKYESSKAADDDAVKTSKAGLRSLNLQDIQRFFDKFVKSAQGFQGQYNHARHGVALCNYFVDLAASHTHLLNRMEKVDLAMTTIQEIVEQVRKSMREIAESVDSMMEEVQQYNQMDAGRWVGGGALPRTTPKDPFFRESVFRKKSLDHQKCNSSYCRTKLGAHVAAFTPVKITKMKELLPPPGPVSPP